MEEAKNKECTLIFNDGNTAYPIALTKDQHQMLQIFISSTLGKIKIIPNIVVKYENK